MENRADTPKAGEKEVDRRQFLKLGTAGAALGAVGMVNAPAEILAGAGDKDKKPASMQEHTAIPIKISKDYKPFPQKETVFSRATTSAGRTRRRARRPSRPT